jgi:basic amino acid/polyamine antiporter, APA family
VFGFVGCVVLAFALPLASVLTGFGVVVLGAAAYLLRRAKGN